MHTIEYLANLNTKGTNVAIVNPETNFWSKYNNNKYNIKRKRYNKLFTKENYN